MREDLLEKFKELFKGENRAYGQWHPTDGPSTKHGAVPTSAYEAHLTGRVGLGIVPVNESGLCRFGAIDIDVDTIDHSELYRKIEGRKMPLNVCRSKSGAAHVYLFTKEPGLPAAAIQQVLQKWAGVLGYPTAEIFPKQTRLGAKNIGSWINLPYFGGDDTTRYAVGPTGARSLEDFLDTVVYYDAVNGVVIDEASTTLKGMPPCLTALCEQGIGQGFRNQALFNFAIFYRKSDPGNWAEATQKLNKEYFSPPLDYREVSGIVDSIGRTKYQYLCEQSPIREHCNRAVCETLVFGVGNKPWHEDGSFDDFVTSNCRKFLSDPPRYLVEVNGQDVTLEWDDLFNFRNFKSSVGQKLNIIIPNLKQPQWEQQLRELLSKKVDIEAPEDASTMGIVLEKFGEFLTLRERASEKEDLLKGLPIQVGEEVMFRASDFKRYLQTYKLDKENLQDVFLVLRRQGCRHHTMRVKGKVTRVWAYPLNQTNEQTEVFSAVDFKNDFGEEM
jgi:hypothetical protein